MGGPGLANQIDLHTFLNIHSSEIIEKPLVLCGKPAPAVSLFMKTWSWKSMTMFDESQSGNMLIVVLLAARASFAPQPLAPNPKPYTVLVWLDNGRWPPAGPRWLSDGS